jgi:hypothetical protein
MSQHLTRNLECKQVVHDLPSSLNLNGPLSFPPPAHVPRHSVAQEHSISSNGSISTCIADENETNGLNPGCSSDEEDMLERDTPFDPNLQDVVSYPTAYSSSAHHEVKLLKLLHDIGAPNYAFQSFMEWGRKCSSDNFHFQPCPQRYESQIKNLTDLVGMHDCRPTTVPVSLEPDDLVLDVITFPFATMLSSLLNCPNLNKLENLVVNPTDRFGRFEDPGGKLDEVNSAGWYSDTYDDVIVDTDKDFLAPIIFAMDKTVISEASHLSVYVILFTTSIFNREVSYVIMYNHLSFCLLLTHFWYPRLGIRQQLGGPLHTFLILI